MGGDNEDGKDFLAKKSILRGDDLPAEDAIARAGSSASDLAAKPTEFAPAVGITRWDEADDEAGDAATAASVEPAPERLELGDDDRLPWLESPDDIGEEGVDSGKIIGFVVLSLVALVMIVGAVWFASNRASGPGPADGSTLTAGAGPYKVPPEAPGGKTFAGTGDTSFAVSEGETRSARIAGADAVPVPAAPAPTAGASSAAKPGFTQVLDAPPAAKAAVNAPAAAAVPAAAGVGVQIGAYTTAADAEKGWTVLSARNAALAGVRHRVVEGRADIGTVFRLQAVTADVATANALCARLMAAGQGCQVKR